MRIDEYSEKEMKMKAALAINEIEGLLDAINALAVNPTAGSFGSISSYYDKIEKIAKDNASYFLRKTASFCPPLDIDKMFPVHKNNKKEKQNGKGKNK